MALAELGNRALELINTMRSHGMRPPASTYLKAMDVCSKAEPRQSFGVILQLLRLLEMDYAQEITGGFYWVVYSSYSRAITACARAGEADKAVELLEDFYLRTRIQDLMGGGQSSRGAFYFGSDHEAVGGEDELGATLRVDLAELDHPARAEDALDVLPVQRRRDVGNEHGLLPAF